MNDEQKRNTLIVALKDQSSLSLSQVQALGNSGSLGSLTGFAAISGLLSSRGVNKSLTGLELSKMSYGDQRNEMIGALAKGSNFFKKTV